MYHIYFVYSGAGNGILPQAAEHCRIKGPASFNQCCHCFVIAEIAEQLHRLDGMFKYCKYAVIHLHSILFLLVSLFPTGDEGAAPHSVS